MYILHYASVKIFTKFQFLKPFQNVSYNLKSLKINVRKISIFHMIGALYHPSPNQLAKKEYKLEKKTENVAIS